MDCAIPWISEKVYRTLVQLRVFPNHEQLVVVTRLWDWDASI
jgi:hypothetical protein